MKAFLVALSAAALIAAPAASAGAPRKSQRVHRIVAGAPHPGLPGSALRREVQPRRVYTYPFMPGPTAPGPALPGAPMDSNPNAGGGGGGM